jgi:C4-dicarboxylate-specific signal transduction histidine kinase
MSARTPSLRRHVLVFAFAMSGVILLSVGVILFIHHFGQARARLVGSLQSTARIVAANSSGALAFGKPADDPTDATEILSSLRHDPLIVSAVLFDGQGVPFATYGRPLDPSSFDEPFDPAVAVIVDVVNKEETHGRLLIVTDNRAELRRTALTWAAVYGFAFVVTVILGLFLARRFERAVAAPIVKLAHTAEDVTTRRDYSVRAAVSGPAEVAALAEAFNTMLLEVGRRDETLARQLVALDQEVRERKAAQDTLKENTRDMLRLSHEAGMAEVAAGVLHNIGNALNSINVSAELLADHLRVRAAVAAGALRDFFRSPPPKAAAVFAALREFVAAYAEHTTGHLDKADEELSGLRTGVAHLKEIVARQQTLAKAPRRSETFDLADAVQEALLIDKTDGHASTSSLRIEQSADREPPHLVYADRSAVVQILINLLANARAALAAASPVEPLLRIHMGTPSDTHLSVAIIDNGVGIQADQLVSIFSYGFTTKSGGHGFGLHNAANTARLLGGALRVRSDGPGRGAVFTLELPRQPQGTSHDA